jgi:hypothetical protein
VVNEARRLARERGPNAVEPPPPDPAAIRRADDHRRAGRPRRRKAPLRGLLGSLDLEHLGARQSQYATFIDYRVKRP